MKDTTKFDIKNLDELSNEDLVRMYNENKKEVTEILAERFSNLINTKITKYYSAGMEDEDLKQEALIGLYKAILSYNGKKETAFKTFATMCIDRQLITALKNANRQKHLPLNTAVSINEKDNDDSDEKIEMLDASTKFNEKNDPLKIIEDNEFFDTVMQKMNVTLTKKEKLVLDELTSGKSYKEIATALNVSLKSVDSAITRIRKKGSKIIDTYNNDKTKIVEKMHKKTKEN